MTSSALWLPLIWIAIIGTRPVSTWFGVSAHAEDPSQYLDGSPFDRNIFLFLMVAGIFVLLKRKINWGAFLTSNAWFFAFMAYGLISLAWSDYAFVGFKRWTKEFGNIIMVLILLTEADPVKAIKSVIARYAYLALPLSVLVIKYFPEVGRYYSNYTWTVGYGGITTNKNALGALVVMCGLFFVWELLGFKTARTFRKNVLTVSTDVLLLVMAAWLLIGARSSTSIVCLGLGTLILFFMQYPSVRNQVRYLGVYGLTIGVVAFVLFSFPGIIEALANLVGRDATLTGRTELWAELKKMANNSLLGTGYQSFWLGQRAEYLWAKFSFHPNQAHNGYLETYLNLGMIGLALLLAFALSAGQKLKQALLRSDSDAVLRFSFFVAALVSNWTEASFSTLTITWMMFLIAIVHNPAAAAAVAPQTAPRSWTSSRYDPGTGILSWSDHRKKA